MKLDSEGHIEICLEREKFLTRGMGCALHEGKYQ